ncbi:MAG: hypothetical protein AAGD86_02415 [Pseudomonadota bacterium]
MQKSISALVLMAATVVAAPALAQSFEEGATFVTLSNLHHQVGEAELYTLNYQLTGMIPMCTEVTVVKRKKKRITLSIDSIEYRMDYDKHSRKAGLSFDDVLGNYFGTECEADKVSAMNDADKRGIREGLPYVGMTKQGILLAMGRPPQHATPRLDTSVWMYWLNRYKRQAIHFDENGVVDRIRL